MKKYILALLLLISFISCEDVIEVETPKDTPRLFVDALIRIDESKPLTDIKIDVGITSSFFEEIQTANLDLLTITNIDQPNTPENPNTVVLNKTTDGGYAASVNTSFLTQGNLVLYIEYDNRNYAANATYTPSTPITSIQQGEDILFGQEETEIVVRFEDLPDRDDYYLLDFDFSEYLVTEDTFYKGKPFEFSYFYDEEVNPETEVTISILGIDVLFYNYMNLVINQAGGDQGPFQAPVSTIKGNIVTITADTNAIDLSNLEQYKNLVDTENFALGYFAVSQVYQETIIVE